jgi:RNA polymerase-binding protein
MSERALRGTRLGATSYETDSGIDLAPRQEVEYSCPSGHRFSMPFSVEAEVPVAWECRVCGAQALRVGGTVEENKPVKPVRTHWDMLLERRSIPELEEVLAERLEVLRGGGIGGGLGVRAHRSAPVNISTGAPAPGNAEAAAARQGDGTATATAPEGSDEAGAPGTAKAAGSTRTAPAKKPVAKKTTAGTAPAKKTAASKGSPATKAADKPVKKPATKKPSSK